MPMARTTESHPLRITAMTLGDGRGRIGFSQCPGRIDRYAISGPWKRDLDADLDAIQHWGATAVVSLITHEEIAYLKVHDLPRAVRDLVQRQPGRPQRVGLGLRQRGNVKIVEDAAGVEIAGQQLVRHLPEEVAGGVVARHGPSARPTRASRRTDRRRRTP